MKNAEAYAIANKALDLALQVVKMQMAANNDVDDPDTGGDELATALEKINGMFGATPNRPVKTGGKRVATNDHAKNKPAKKIHIDDDKKGGEEEDEEDGEDDDEDEDEDEKNSAEDEEIKGRYGKVSPEQLASLAGTVAAKVDKCDLKITALKSYMGKLFVWKGNYSRTVSDKPPTGRQRGQIYTAKEIFNIDVIASYIKLVMPEFTERLRQYVNPRGRKTSSGRVGTITDAILSEYAKINEDNTPLAYAFDDDDGKFGEVTDMISKAIVFLDQTIENADKKSSKAEKAGDDVQNADPDAGENAADDVEEDSPAVQNVDPDNEGF